MATIRKIGSRWHARVRKKGVDRSENFRTKSEAVAWSSRIETEIEDKRLGIIPDKTFGDLLERYIREISPSKDSHHKNEIRFNAMIKRGDPLLCVGLRHITSLHVSEWRDRRLSVVKASSVNREWNLLSVACTVANREWKWLASNPFSDTRRPPATESRTRLVSEAEILALDDAAPTSCDLSSTRRVFLAFCFAAETALRAGELCALRWSNVCTKERTLTVEALLPGARKSGKSRLVPLSKPALEILEQLHGHHPVSVFDLTTASLDALFRKLRAKAGLSGFTFHDSRALALTRLSKKLNPLQLAKVAGHSDLQQLIKTYFREDPSDWARLLD